MARTVGAMHVAKISRRHGDREYESYLVRRSVREGRRVRHETVANVSQLPAEAIEALTLALKGVRLVPEGEAFEIVRSRKHGHVEAVLTVARRLGLARLLDRAPSRERDLCLAMIVGRVLEPGSKLACTRQLQACTLGEELGVQGAAHDDMYAAMDWLLERQDQVEQRLARRHLKEGELALYDVSCSYFEGRTCPLARFGYDHGSGKRGRMQVEYGLVCDSDGRPVAIEAFEGSLKDSKTLPSQIEKLEQRFGLSRVIVVTDRGIGTKENVTLLSETAEFAFITALKAPQVRALVREGCLQLSMFDELNLAEIACEKLYPGQRLVVCRNPLVAEERARKRRELLTGTEKDLSEIKRRVEAGTLQGQAEIGLAVGAVWNRYKVKKHFQVNITDDTLTYQRKHEQIAQEAELDGIYVIRSGRIDPEQLAATGIVRAYKQLKEAEKGFGGIKGPLEVRPIHHRLEDRVRAHLLICMLAEYLRWHLRHAWTPSPAPATRKPSGCSAAGPPRKTSPQPCTPATPPSKDIEMEHRMLGRTGVSVSKFCLGAMMFGAWGNPDHDESIRIIHAALGAGINFVDTADVYAQGESEEIVGKALAGGRRDNVILATKLHMPMGEDPNQQGSSRRWIIREVENSLRRLNTDWIDLYQVHRSRTDTDIEETLGALSDLVHQGKVRYVGSSTFPASQIVEAQWVARDRHLQRFVTEQPPYSMLVRQVEADVLPTCARHGMGVLSYSPLAGGWLSGRWRQDTGQQSSSRANRLPERFDLTQPGNQRKLDAVEQLAQLAEQTGITLIELAIAFVLRHPAITSAIIGPRTMDQLESQLPAANVELDGAVLDRIDEVVPPGITINPVDNSFLNPALEPAARRR